MDSHDVNDTRRSARCRWWLGALALAVAGQREGQGPAIGSDPTVQRDLEYFGGGGAASR